MQDQTIQQLRSQVDIINKELVAMLNKRAALAQKIGVAKQAEQIYVPSREAAVLAAVRVENAGPLSGEAMTNIFKEIIAACRNLEQRLRVAFLGPAGTYSEEAARNHAGASSAFLPASTIDEALAMVQKSEADIAVVPVENSTEGAVNRTLDLLLESNLTICGEILLPVHHQLLTKAKKVEDISEVIAHPQALAQCRRWLEDHLPRASQTPASSNAEAARRAAGSIHQAAIASVLAGQTYKLPTLAGNIEDVATNTTRFLALGAQAAEPTGNDRTSIVCSVPNRAGSLYELLGIFAKKNVNMTKLESRPAESALWDYVFYIDVDGHAEDKGIAGALREAKEHATLVKILGSYPKAKA